MDTAGHAAYDSPTGWVKLDSGASCSDAARKSSYFAMTCYSSAPFFPSLEDDPFSSPLPIGDSAFAPAFLQPLQIANELWWDVLSRLSLPDRMQARLVCQLFNSIIASQLRHVTISRSPSSMINSPQVQPDAEYSEDKLLRFMGFLRRDCHHLKGTMIFSLIWISCLDLMALSDMSAGMTVSSDIKSSNVFMGTICGMQLTSLSFYGCTNFSDRHLASLSNSSLSCSVEFLILCGTRITGKGITVRSFFSLIGLISLLNKSMQLLQSFEKLSRLFVCSTRAAKKTLNLLQPSARESGMLSQ